MACSLLYVNYRSDHSVSFYLGHLRRLQDAFFIHRSSKHFSVDERMRGQNTNVDVKEVDWRILKRLVPYLKAYKGRVVLALFCLVLAKVASVYLPFILKNIVDTLDFSSNDLAISLPLGLLLAYGFVRLINVIMGEVRDTIFGRVTEGAMHRVGLNVFQHLLHLDLDFHISRRTGGLALDIDRGIKGISFLLRFMVFNIVPTLLEIGLITIVLWVQYDFTFALVILAAVIAYVSYSVVATEKRTRFVRAVNNAESTTSTRAVDALLNFETVKYFNNENYESSRYDKELSAWEHARRKNRLSLFALNGGQALIISLSMTIALILAAQGVVKQTMTLGDFVLINAFMMQIFMPLNFLGFVYREMKGSMANIDRMFSVMSITPKVRSPHKAKRLESVTGGFSFESVEFSYDKQRTVLKSINFAVKPGQKVAIVGSSGSGKSTITKLLFRFYDPTAGAIVFDGEDIRTLSLQQLRQAIAVVPQDTVLFNASLRDNIAYGAIDPDHPEQAVSDDLVEQAVSRAHLSSFVSQLPQGLETIVGERGLKLSGGERQRVAIARAILKQPPLMIFDEATSSLDSASEQIIIQAINEVSQNQTTLVIAHRLSTVVDADRILVLEDGQIVEEGSHSELLEKSGRYAELWSHQQSNSQAAMIKNGE